MKESDFVKLRAEAEFKAEPLVRIYRQSLIEMYMKGYLDALDACYDEEAAEKKLAEEEEGLKAMEQGEEPIVKLKPDAILKRKIVFGKDLSVRASKALRVHNIDTLGDLIKISELDLLKMWGLGRNSLLEIREFVKSFGYELKTK